MTVPPEATTSWGPEVPGGRAFRRIRRFALGLGAVLAGVLLVAAVVTQVVWSRAEGNLTRVPLSELSQAAEMTGARFFLVVGSDSRDGLSDEDRAKLPLGDFDGERADVMILVGITPDRQHVSLVSMPRDLLVLDGERYRKLTDVFNSGADNLVRVIRTNTGIGVNHYAAMSFGGFIEIVRTLGTVEVCLDTPLRDRRAGADFTAGCHDMTASDALAYVRSRSGPRGDFERIERQQTFIRAVLKEMVSTRVLTNPRQLLGIVENVSRNVTTDSQFRVSTMAGLADELRTIVGQGLPMTTVPAHPRRIDGIEYMAAYGPGARALYAELLGDTPVADRGTRDEKQQITVAVASASSSDATRIVAATLQWAGFRVERSRLSASLEAPDDTTTVYAKAADLVAAQFAAATLGAPLVTVTDDVELPADVVVAAGSDALT
ncbi:MAG: LCP family protein [Nitriliruptoraceae bacterium]